ncbi:MAG: efflux RND transporter permease subunit, partial [Salinisphaera sp.]|nr:efflux RND transporter permease subunit [Salinisphaera sp.]
MKGLIAASFRRPRTVLVALVAVLIAGSVAYVDIPKESSPDVTIPLIYVSMVHRGIAPEDAVRLLIKPMEQELQALEGLKEIRATAGQSYAYLILEFQPGFDADAALEAVRNRVDQAEHELPEATEQPEVKEVNLSLFPVLVINLYGQVSERMRVRLAQRLQDKLEALPGVLEVNIGGDREEQIEILINPTRLRTYGLSLEQVARAVAGNNQLVAAGALTTGSGRFPITLPGVIDKPEELLNLAIKESDGQVVTVADVASVRRSFRDPQSYARVNGEPALALEVVKRPGANIVETIAAVRQVANAASAAWPDAVKVSYSQDRSKDVRSMLSDLQNNVAASVLLVMVMIVAILGVRAGLLVGVSIPGSFVLGVLVLAAMGLTINIVVLFSLILALGLLVDGAITVVELGDRYQAEGQSRGDAYMHAAQRLAWPILSSTLCMVAAFLPLLFWPGVIGQFMFYLPITLIAVLAASLLMALIFVPNLGGVMGGTPPSGGQRAWRPGEPLRGFDGAYIRLLQLLLRHPGKVVLAAVAALVASFVLYGQFGKGLTFFPDIEPDNAVVQIRARGALSLDAIDRLVRQVENRILPMDAFASVYARSGLQFRNDSAEDLIGQIQLEFKDWQLRPPAEEVLTRVRERVAGIPGIEISVSTATPGPTQPKP